MKYLNWKEEKIINFTEENISKMYNNGFVFTRLEKGIMQQTRSIRVNLDKFELSSENRRILRKGENISVKENSIPYLEYTWEIGKLAKDFYNIKAAGAFSANKIKELITTDHNFNKLLSFSDNGYAICYKNSQILHYCYPFYDLEKSAKDMGLIMMTKIIDKAKENKLKYVYLGSMQRQNDIYKLQFSGIEWFDGEKWTDDISEIKRIIKEIK